VAVAAGQIRQLREWDHRVDALVRSGELGMRIVRRDTILSDGRVHERYDQYHQGVRVVGGDMVRQARDGVTESIFGRVHGSINLPTEPRIDVDTALARLAALADPQRPPRRRPELVILTKDDGRYALAWRSHVWTASGWMHTFLDANDGSIVLQYNDLQTQSAVGTGHGVLGDRKKISTRAAPGLFLADDQLRPPTLITYDAQGDLSSGRTPRTWTRTCTSGGRTTICSSALAAAVSTIATHPCARSRIPSGATTSSRRPTRCSAPST
jgi:Zn-dependent metalloprotease